MGLFAARKVSGNATSGATRQCQTPQEDAALSLSFQTVAAIAIVVAASVSVAYAAAALAVVVARNRRPSAPRAAPIPRISILKPLCGAEPGLEDNLRSFCREAGPRDELLFGARDAHDPALAIARQVMAEFPAVDARIVIGAPMHGLNAKINILVQLTALARYDVLVIADSDTRIRPGHLADVVAPLRDASVGIVSCLFRGRPTRTLWSQLGALGIDEMFIPSVLVSRALGSPAYCSGPMIAMRRAVLDAIGGIGTVAPYLADDYELGVRVRRLGYRSAIADREIIVTVNEPTWRDLFGHELRWMRTVRTVTPLGYAFSVLTYAVPLTALAAVVAGGAPWSLALVAVALALRAELHWSSRRSAAREAAGGGVDSGPDDARGVPLWLVPLRDFLSLGMWIASYASRTVQWRGRTMWVTPDGLLHPHPAGSMRLGIGTPHGEES